MSGDSYEILYFNFWGRIDITQMILELSDAKYEHVVAGQDWLNLKSEQRFGVVPRLTIKSADGTTKYLWESVAIDAYLAETFNLLPSTSFERADAMSIVYSLRELADKVSSTVKLPSVEERGKAHRTHIAQTIPNHLKWHEEIIERNGGIYYYNDKVLLPDLVITALYLRYKDMYGDENPINATNTPKIARLVETILAGKIGTWARLRRDKGTMAWNKDEFEFKRVATA